MTSWGAERGALRLPGERRGLSLPTARASGSVGPGGLHWGPLPGDRSRVGPSGAAGGMSTQWGSQRAGQSEGADRWQRGSQGADPGVALGVRDVR